MHYLKTENVELFVVGEPKQMNNTESESEQFIKLFVEKLKTTFPKIPVKRVDERFTSKMALVTSDCKMILSPTCAMILSATTFLDCACAAKDPTINKIKNTCFIDFNMSQK